MFVMQDMLQFISWEKLDLGALEDEKLSCEVENLVRANDETIID
jgi:hypothetical protein